jgi:predicted oxidoreductase
MYTVNFAPERGKVKIHSVCNFEPHGADVYLTQLLITIQLLDLSIKIYDLIHYGKILQMRSKPSRLDLVEIL